LHVDQLYGYAHNVIGEHYYKVSNKLRITLYHACCGGIGIPRIGETPAFRISLGEVSV